LLLKGVFPDKKSKRLKVLRNSGKKWLKLRVSYFVSGIIFLTNVLPLLRLYTSLVCMARVSKSSCVAGKSIAY